MDLPELKEIELGSGPLRYRLGGEGPLLVIFHGLAGRSGHYHFQFKYLCSRFRILVPGLRGQGESPAGAEPVGFDAGVRDAVELIEALGFGAERLHLLGHSMGGMLAQEFAMAQPDRLESLILACTAARSDFGPVHEFLRRRVAGLLPLLTAPHPIPTLALLAQLYLFGVAEIEVVDWIRNLREAYTPEVMKTMAACYRSLDGWDRRAELGRVRAPTLALFGDRDPVIPRAFYSELVECLPAGARTEWISPSGHNPQFDNFREFNRVVADFIDGVEAGAS